jgi:hypothetical protein
MINNKKYDNSLIKGENTLKYDDNKKYKHFFIFAQHADYYKKENQKKYPVIGEYIIPNEIVKQHGFGFYGGVKTMRNDKLSNFYIPLPEIIVAQDDFKNEYLYKVESEIYHDFITKKLDNNDNEEYKEPIDECYLYNGSGEHGFTGYLDYSYADIYYEIIYQLAKRNNMNLNKVAEIIKKVDLRSTIEQFFIDNAVLFEKQTKKYIKTKKYK